jgi:hypothetical protein
MDFPACQIVEQRDRGGKSIEDSTVDSAPQGTMASMSRRNLPAPDRPPVPWTELILLFLASRALFLLVAWLSPLVVTRGRFAGHPGDLAADLHRWDSNWYIIIAQSGYATYEAGAQSAVAFFPLYPMAMRALGAVVGNLDLAGYLISNAALFGAVVLMWRLAEDWGRAPDGRPVPGDGSRSVRLLLFGPVSFFFSLIFSEATFLFLTLLCFHAMHRRIWWLAALAGFAAALTRNAGLLLAIPMLLEYFQVSLKAPHFRRHRPWGGVALASAPLAGLAAWAWYLGWKFGDPLIFAKVQEAWGRRLSWPWDTFRTTWIRHAPFYRFWFIGHALAGLALVAAAAFLRMRPSLVAFAGLAVLLNVSAGHLEAVPRLLSSVFPLYMAGAAVTRRWPKLGALLLELSVVLLVFSTILYANGYWFT